MQNYIIYAFFLFFKGLILLLPSRFNTLIFKGLGSFLYSLNLKHRRIILKNLDFAFGDKLTDEAKEQIAKRCYQNFLVYTEKFVEFSNKSLDRLNAVINYENKHYLTDAVAKGEKVILVSAHFGVWEVILQAVGGNIIPLTTIREDIKNSSLLNDTLIKYRGKNNVEMFHKEGALLGVVKALKRGKALAYLVDQNFKHGVAVEFFGKKVLHIHSASQMSRKFDALIVPVFCTTDDYENYTIAFQEPFKCDKTDDEEKDILLCTQKQSDIIQAMVEARPHDYFWFHKKFKGKYPELYQNL
jgi:KDO2-lipid IV(A) lauroyltransferase